MHDFCFTIPYGMIVLAGGVVGYVRKGSVVSLAGGVSVGLLLLLAGFISLKAFERRRNSFFALFLETHSLHIFNFGIETVDWSSVCSVTLTVVMGKRYIDTTKIMPAGVVAGISALMTIFYLYKLVGGGNHIPAKAE